MTWIDELKFLGEKILFTFGIIMNMFLNIILIPYYIVRKVSGNPPKELIIWPKAVKDRVDMYGKIYLEEQEKKTTNNP